MSTLKAALKKLGLHTLLIFGALFILLIVFFRVYLPSYTNHGETVTVPDLQGYAYEELQNIIISKDLRYEITPDSGFMAEAKPLAVLKQYPRAGSKVKKDRKIYITLNAKNAPLIKMPNLVNTPLKNAQEIIANHGLVRGDIVYVPDIGTNVVLEQKYRGRPVKEGFEISKGSQIDLVVGDGLGKQNLSVPDLLGMDETDAEFLIIGSGLRMGRIAYVETDTVPKGTIVQQSPPAGINAKTGEIIDIWISEMEEYN
ncbi:PASTA domain-containing protein [Litoribacter populi]|uniref:PASTA domain-containing protein n=1 Tax=Litoribacter populi TaxID=2598460 RepID=UPI00117D79F1|nr:PASTA domain-containing protein [Litoribacter populi]